LTRQNTIKNRKFVISLARGLSILSAFDQSHPILGISDLSIRTGLSKSTIYRIVYTLQSLGYIIPSAQSKKYALGPKVLDLGYAVLSSLELREVAQPYLLELSHRVKETVNLAVLDEWRLIYIERIKTQQIVNINLHVGSRLDLYNTAMGRVLAAFNGKDWFYQYIDYLKKIPSAELYWKDGGKKLEGILKNVRHNDYAINDEELTPGLRSVASPVRNRDKQVIAAVNIAVSSSLFSLKRLKEELIAPLKETTKAISSALGFEV